MDTTLRITRLTAGSEAPVPDFGARLTRLCDSEWPRLSRYLDRLTGDPDLAADLAQEAFVRLHRRGSMPDAPGSWLVSVAMNLLRNEMSMRQRRRKLLTPGRAERAHADPAPSPEQEMVAEEVRARVRAAIDAIPERERQLLLLRAEDYSYRDIAAVVGVSETSVGTLLARARVLFEQAYGSTADAP